MRIGAVVAAAGMSSRMKAFKPMLELEGSTIIQKTLSALQEAGVKNIAVVIGHKGAQLKKHLASQPVQIVENPSYQNSEMFDSIKLGIEALIGHCDILLLLPADIPLFQPETVRQLCAAMQKGESSFASPQYMSRKGHPLAVNASMLPDLLRYRGEGGLKGAIAMLGGEHLLVEVDDPGILLDADCPEDYLRLQEYAAQQTRCQPIQFDLEVQICRQVPFWNLRLNQLLQAIEMTGSLNKGCEQISISYSKGWGMIKQAQHCLGIPLLETSVGGASGGGSTLTPECRLVMESYSAFCSDLQNQAKSLFAQHFTELFQVEPTP